MLPLGTQVGSWRVVDWAGQGVYGVVYRAVRIGEEHMPPAALKLALIPEDPRFAREQELLSRMLHPHVPRLLDHGHWRSPQGALHPFVVMEWVDGVPLYDWARLYRPTAPQQLRLLAQLVFALQCVHAQGAAHRDIKGGNLLVRRSDSRLFLTDFGSGLYPGADTLTPQHLLPGTPAYRSPEAWLFSLGLRHASARYEAGPADDIFAVGVTACVLATGAYPEMGQPRRDEQGNWHLDSLVLPPELFSARVAQPLREVILRMLSVVPEQRGTAAQLTQWMEQTADALSIRRSPPSASVPELPVVRSAEAPAASPPSSPRTHGLSRRRWLAAAAGALAAGAVWTALDRFTWEPAVTPPLWEAEPQASRGAAPDAGPVGLGEAVMSASAVSPPGFSAAEAMVADSPLQPSEGQAQPDKKGRCPHPLQVVLSGHCWERLEMSHDRCEGIGGQMYQGACYVPFLTRGSRRPTTSSPGSPR